MDKLSMARFRHRRSTLALEPNVAWWPGETFYKSDGSFGSTAISPLKDWSTSTANR